MLRRGWAAGIASGFAHALLLAILLWLGRARPTVEREPPIEIEFAVETPTPETPAAPEPPTIPSPNPGARRRTAAPPPSVPPLPDDPGEPRPTLPPTPAAPAAPPHVATARTPNLSLDIVPAARRAEIAGPTPDVVLPPRRARPSVDELRAAEDRRRAAAATVADGRVDPLLYDYLRGAKTRFEAEARRLADAIALGAGDTVRGWGRGYLHRIKNARQPGPTDRAAELPDDAARRRPDLAAAYAESTRAAEAGAERRRAEICLDVAPGRDTTATVLRGSGNAALDAVALEAFEKSTAARPVPPDARAGRACYEVSISAYRAPPLPFFTCSFDLGTTGATCAWPFKKITSVTGKLLSFDHPPN